MVPGLSEAKYVQEKIRQAGIQDIQLFFDPQAKIWAVCQVQKHGGILLPDYYAQDDIRPHILFYCKNEVGAYRVPNDQDIIDVIATVQRSDVTFKQGGDWLADKLDEQDKQKYAEGRKKLTERVHSVSKPLQKAIREELG